jgi:hypothetical protein
MRDGAAPIRRRPVAFVWWSRDRYGRGFAVRPVLGELLLGAADRPLEPLEALGVAAAAPVCSGGVYPCPFTIRPCAVAASGRFRMITGAVEK